MLTRSDKEKVEGTLDTLVRHMCAKEWEIVPIKPRSLPY